MTKDYIYGPYNLTRFIRGHSGSLNSPGDVYVNGSKFFIWVNQTNMTWNSVDSKSALYELLTERLNNEEPASSIDLTDIMVTTTNIKLNGHWLAELYTKPKADYTPADKDVYAKIELFGIF